MKSSPRLLKIWWVVWPLLSFFSSAITAAPLLNGIALHKELGQEQFWGALYSDELTNEATALLHNAVPKRMELKVLAHDGIPARRFSRMWIEGAAINNSTSVLTEQAENMSRFDAFFQGKLEANDWVVFSVTPGEGVRVVVNSVPLGTIADDNFFAVLLSTWLGRVPLSSGFRDELLKMGEVNSDLLHRYESLEPRLSRIAVVKSWVNDDPPSVVAASAENNPPLAALQEKPKVAAVALPVIAVAPSAEALQEKAIADAAAKKHAAEVAEKAGLAAQQAKEKAELNAQILLAQQFYISDVLNSIYSKVNYPRRAQQLQQTGVVKLAVVIDSQGNIKSLNALEVSEYSLLNKAAQDAVKESALFPPLPSVLVSQELEFSIPIKFALSAS